MVMFGGLLKGRVKAQSSRHSQMNDEGISRCKTEDQIFCSAIDLVYGTPFAELLQARKVHGMTECLATEAYILNPSAQQFWPYSSTDNLYLW